MSKNSRVIVGLGKTGLSYARYLTERNLDYKVLDDNPNNACVSELNKIKPEVEIRRINSLSLKEVSEIYLSPGVPLSNPKISEARRNGVKVYGDIEIFCNNATFPIIAITGTNGKSTVSKLTELILSKHFRNVVLAGNIGEPALDSLGVNPCLAVLELSSFQLELAPKIKSEVAVLLNLSDDHLDRYESQAAYFKTKLSVYRECKKAVINRVLLDRVHRDFEQIATFGSDQKDGIGNFGIRKEEDEYFLMHGSEKLVSESQLKLKGNHNLQNVLASIAIGWLLGIELDEIIRAVRDFEGLPHRSELVGEKDGILFVNDSKATNSGALLASVEGQAKNHRIHLIVGGETKGSNFHSVVKQITPLLDSVFVIGNDQDQILREFSPCDAISCQTLHEAVSRSYENSKSGDMVLLAPGCASTDQFDNFEERGDVFREAVQQVIS